MTTPTTGDNSFLVGHQSGRLLLVEDHDQSRRSLGRLLEAAGFHVEAVKNGRAALEALQREVPDFVMTDLSLPDLDGRLILEAARQLNPRPWIAVMTGWDVSGEEALRLQLDHVFLKPIELPLIVSTLNQAALGRQSMRLTEGESSSS